MLAFKENFYQNQFINEYTKKKKSEISESQSFFYWDIEELTF